MLWTGSNLSISSGKRTRKWALKPWGVKETKSSHFFSRTLLPPLLSLATRAWLLSIFLKWRACSQAFTVFTVVRDGCIVLIMAPSIPSVPIPPKAFVKCWHLLWRSTSEQKRTKLLKLSSVAKPRQCQLLLEIFEAKNNNYFFLD